MQHEITEKRPLLDSRGNIAEPGYAKSLLAEYSRADIKAPAHRIKEWDYYLVTDGKRALALTIADNGYMGLDSISWLDFESNFQQTLSPISVLPMGKRKLPQSSSEGDTVVFGKGYELAFRHRDGNRVLSFRMENFADAQPIEGHITLSDEPPESMVICTPFKKRGHFYYNQKINCLRAEGMVKVRGEVYRFTPDEAFGVLDWGRGVWTYHNTWYWGSASGLYNGVRIGWNIGCGFGDSSAATENMLFYDGRAHKLESVSFNIPIRSGRYVYMSPWGFTSSDGRFQMMFKPVMDRASCTDLKLVKSDQHQVFGYYSGTIILDDGRKLTIPALFGFAERVENKW